MRMFIIEDNKDMWLVIIITLLLLIIGVSFIVILNGWDKLYGVLDLLVAILGSEAIYNYWQGKND